VGRTPKVVGGDPRCDARIGSDTISRCPCCLAEKAGAVVVRDLGSTNGIRINGRRVLAGWLRLGDEQSIAERRCRHERRASGRRRASPGLVVMGSARVISSVATRLRPEECLVLRRGYVPRWRELRAGLEARRESRRKQRRFRHDPASYLTGLEQKCLQLLLPS
jgi:hypothetical protein